MCIVQLQSAYCQKHERLNSVHLKIEPFLNHHSRFQFTWYVQHTQIEKVTGNQVQISRFSGFPSFQVFQGFQVFQVQI